LIMWIEELKFVVAILLACILAAGIHPCWKTCTRDNLHGGWALILLLPAINIVAVYFYAVKTRRLGAAAQSS